MPVYLDTRGNSVLSVAICDRCSRKFAYTELYPDPNFPGMRVCKDDLDQFDPWRLPARQTENIALRFPRPDTPIGTGNNLLNTQGNPNDPVQYDNFVIQGIPPAAGSQGVLDLNGGYSSAQVVLLPIIHTVSPTSGPQAGGTLVTITGNNFNGATSVTFAGTSAAFTIVSDTELTATTPASAYAGIADISVSNTSGTATSHGAFTYT